MDPLEGGVHGIFWEEGPITVLVMLHMEGMDPMEGGFKIFLKSLEPVTGFFSPGAWEFPQNLRNPPPRGPCPPFHGSGLP